MEEVLQLQKMTQSTDLVEMNTLLSTRCVQDVLTWSSASVHC